MSTKQLALFKVPAKPKHKYGASISDYGTLREWDRPLTPCERADLRNILPDQDDRLRLVRAALRAGQHYYAYPVV